jgi:Fe2+ or Zn2+ uptake regulation protein
MLKRLFTSKVRIKLLTVFLNNPDQDFFIRELTRRLDEQINSVRRELDNLKKIGLLTSKTKNRKKYYTVNKNFILFNELKTIVNKGDTASNSLSESIQKLGQVDLILLSGHFVNKASEVDLLVVGDINKQKLASYLDKELDASIKFSLMPKEDFLYRIKLNDKFILEFLNDNDNIISVNNLTDEL